MRGENVCNKLINLFRQIVFRTVYKETAGPSIKSDNQYLGHRGTYAEGGF